MGPIGSKVVVMKMGRPLGFDPDKALAQATKLFWEKGYEATSTKDLMAVMQLSKSSLYQTFGSKQALFNDCLDLYGRDSVQQLREALATASSPLLMVETLFRDTAKQIAAARDSHRKAKHTSVTNEPMGCFLVNTACELGGDDPSVGALLTQRTGMVRQVLHDAVTQAIELGELSEETDAAQLSAYLFSNLCGLRVMGSIVAPEEDLEKIIDQILVALK